MKEETETTRFEIRLTKEKEHIKKNAERSGYKSVSKYIRDRALHYQPPTPRTDIDAVYQLQKIGINLNQITRRFNIVSDESEYDFLRKAIQESLNKVNKTLQEIIKK